MYFITANEAKTKYTGWLIAIKLSNYTMQATFSLIDIIDKIIYRAKEELAWQRKEKQGRQDSLSV